MAIALAAPPAARLQHYFAALIATAVCCPHRLAKGSHLSPAWRILPDLFRLGGLPAFNWPDRFCPCSPDRGHTQYSFYSLVAGLRCVVDALAAFSREPFVAGKSACRSSGCLAIKPASGLASSGATRAGAWSVGPGSDLCFSPALFSFACCVSFWQKGAGGSTAQDHEQYNRPFALSRPASQI